MLKSLVMGGCCCKESPIWRHLSVTAISIPEEVAKITERHLSITSTRGARPAHHNDKRRKLSCKMLVLGAADAGKSTLIRNIRMIHEQSFSQEEMFSFRLKIRAVSFEALASLLASLGKCTGRLAKDIEMFQRKVAERQADFQTAEWSCESKLFELALALWQESLVQEAIASLDEPFLANLGNILDPTYVPSHEDILSLRMPTTGTHQTHIESEEMIMTLIDVGASLADYDLFENEDDPETNLMLESVKLFESICNVKWFAHAALLLFLNKKDIFEEKIKSKSLSICFPDYDGPQASFEAASTHAWKKFEEQCKIGRQIYRHFTCAKDKSNIAKVFASVKDDIMRTTLATVGLS